MQAPRMGTMKRISHGDVLAWSGGDAHAVLAKIDAALAVEGADPGMEAKTPQKVEPSEPAPRPWVMEQRGTFVLIRDASGVLLIDLPIRKTREAEAIVRAVNAYDAMHDVAEAARELINAEAFVRMQPATPEYKRYAVALSKLDAAVAVCRGEGTIA